ncbi:MAG: XRE family transcriptional regulator, partial [Solirubrobacteraceae bacterium]
MPLVLSTAQKLEDDATKLPVATIAGLLQDTLGQRMTAYLAGLNDVKQIGRYRKPGGPRPTTQVELRLREGYKVVSMIRYTYDTETAKAWLFGTNSRLDDQAPIGMLRIGKTP